MIWFALGALWTLILTVVVYEAVFANDPAPPQVPSGAATPDLPEWRRMWYDTAHSDIQWSKEQGWGAVRMLVVLQAALVTARKTFFGAASLDLMIGIAAAASVLTVIHEVDLHRFARKARTVADRILADVPEQVHYLGGPRAHDRHHVFYLAVKLAVAGVVTTLAVLGLA